MKTTSLLLRSAALALIAPAVPAQSVATRPPVIDVHYHGRPTPSPAMSLVDSLNIRYRVIELNPVMLDAWQSVDRERFLPSLGLIFNHGRDLFGGAPGMATPGTFPDTTWLRNEIKAGRVRAFGELIPAYAGMSPTDPRLEPYWSMAEEFDLPVGIHMGSGPPGAAYMTKPFQFPEYRAAYGNPMLLEEVLMRHKRLRLSVMHAGWPMLDQMVALLYAHPGVNVDVGVLQQEQFVPRAAYYRHLRGLVEAGFGKRIMFGSDTPSGSARVGIDAILAADFLSAEQKSDILCGNAMRFYRLPESVCRPGP
ncbi:MAG: amidohydrolase family protein [Gemmatimonadaceae bacterium]